MDYYVPEPTPPPSSRRSIFYLAIPVIISLLLCAVSIYHLWYKDFSTNWYKENQVGVILTPGGHTLPFYPFYKFIKPNTYGIVLEGQREILVRNDIVIPVNNIGLYIDGYNRKVLKPGIYKLDLSRGKIVQLVPEKIIE